ncbi:MAG: hypothetical protein A3F72_02925 [Bacteroidetes bacterium RIFCSPLOWO2_12_FULL_35_15]|nr:MAG: hypothetical protein A3F72_02925 [Bacteroidetes bacterium RIFCSPLOWO2_12_FULL_35_15]
MAKVKLYDKDHGTYYFRCPAGHDHYINTIVPNQQNAQWGFNGDVNNPTFTPSINEKAGRFVDVNVKGNEEWLSNPENSYHCHFIITNGKIKFCGDCSHELKNLTIELPEI